MQKAIQDAERLSDESLLIVWECLCEYPYDDNEMRGDITMLDWMKIVYGELHYRGIMPS